MKKDIIIPVLTLTLICLLVAGALALMNNATAPIILASAIEREQAAMHEKLPLANGFERIEYAQFPASVRDVYSSTNAQGHIFIAAVTGFSGDITVMAAVDEDGRIIDVSTLSHTETQGIGTIIEMPTFLDLFIGRDSALGGVDTVAGATISTRAFIRAVDDIMTAFEMLP